jgi:hypothetical protein
MSPNGASTPQMPPLSEAPKRKSGSKTYPISNAKPLITNSIPSNMALRLVNEILSPPIGIRLEIGFMFFFQCV